MDQLTAYPAEFIAAWMADSAACDFTRCDVAGVSRVLEQRLSDAWEHNREAERRSLLQLKEALQSYQESLLQEMDAELSQQPVTVTEAGIQCFQTLSQAVACLAGYLERDEASELMSQFAHSQHPRPTEAYEIDAFSQRLFPQLRTLHREIDFRARYRDQRFPPGETQFKLGGHMQELGCIHLDFTKIEQGWVLEAIWQCR